MAKKILLGCLKYGLLLVLISSVSFFLIVAGGVFGHTPTEEELGDIRQIEGSIIFAENGSIIGKLYRQDRTVVPLDKINPSVIYCLISTEDQRFYDHGGVDYVSLIRVFFKTLLSGDRSAGGGSTISQQLAKNLFPRKEYKRLYYPINKTREIIIARRLEKHYDKNEILELYLNTVSFGSDIYGIESAANRFFSKSALALEWHEAATLIGTLKATTSYSPINHPEKSLKRRNLVLQLAMKQGYMKTEEFEGFKDRKLETNYTSATPQLASYFQYQVKKEVEKILADVNKSKYTKYDIYQSGLKIHTTLDTRMQLNAEAANRNHMTYLQNLFDKNWDGWNGHKTLLGNEVEKIRGERSDEELNYKRDMTIYINGSNNAVEMSVIDSLKHYLQFLHSGFSAINPESGAVKVWVGGIDYQVFPYDHVQFGAKRQVGSVFKPIVYASALEKGISPCSYYKAEQLAYEDVDGEWIPANSNNNYEGKYSMEGALAGSVNTVSVKILNDVGLDKVISLAHNLGIKSDIPEVPSIALGSASISLLEMLSVYSVFANGGNAVHPYFIEKIEDKNGNIIFKHEALTNNERVISERNSQIMVHLLKNVISDGTGKSLRTKYNLKSDLGGKTGTTQNNADGWFISISPNLVAGAWVGAAYPEISFKNTKYGQGAAMALPIVGEFYKQLESDKTFNNYSQSRFSELDDQLKRELECDPFKEDFNLFKWLFSKDKRNTKEPFKKKNKVAKKNIFKRIGNLFKGKESP